MPASAKGRTRGVAHFKYKLVTAGRSPAAHPGGIAAPWYQNPQQRRLNDQFEPHGLEKTRVEQIKSQLQKVRGLESAYLFRKLLEGPANPTIHMLAFTTLYPWREGQNAQHVNALFEELSAHVQLPAPSLMISLDGRNRSYLPRIHGIVGAQLFGADDHGLTYDH